MSIFVHHHLFLCGLLGGIGLVIFVVWLLWVLWIFNGSHWF